MSDYFEEVEYVALESGDSTLMARVENLKINDHFIAAYADKKIWVFTRSGDFYSKIDKYGKGAGEYTFLSNFNFKNDSTIGLIDIDNSKYIEYHVNGTLQSEIKIPASSMQFSYSENDDLLVVYPFPDYGNNDFHFGKNLTTNELFLEDTTFKELLSSEEKIRGLPSTTNISFYRDRFGDLQYWSFKYDKLLKKEKQGTEYAQLTIDTQEGDVISLFDFYSSFYLSSLYDGKLYHFIMDKETGHIKKFVFEEGGYLGIIYAFENDIDYGLPFVPKFRSEGDYFVSNVSFQQINDLKNHRENYFGDCTHTGLLDIVTNGNENMNNVIMIAQLK